MSLRPTIRKTYGKPKLAASSSSSSSIFFDSPAAGFSSSPPSSDPIFTPGASLPTPWGEDEAFANKGEPSSPLKRARSSSPSIEYENLFVDTKQIFGKAKEVVTVQSSLRGFFNTLPRKQALAERTTIPPAIKSSNARPENVETTIKKQSLTQLHLTHLPLLHTCKECSMSYVRGGEDEGLHAKHHIKVVRGITWDGLGKGKGKGKGKDMSGGWRVIRENIKYGRRNGKEEATGRIIMCDGSWGGNKLDDILSTVDTVLSSPPLPIPILDHCRIFIFVTSSLPPSAKRQRPLTTKEGVERIVSIVVSQPIKTAMRVLRPGEDNSVQVVDSGGGVICDPQPLDTPLGIHRLFTIPSYRSFSLAQHLLEAACRHTVYGCTFDPKKGEVAFSQPTESGRKAMERLGNGNVRVFVDDERQI